MLEARHLRKTYKTKGGVLTKALDDVSVTFAEKGMVFILGKSGSGKSTLLNVCGGLDTMDSGEILIKGRSSADKGDFDFDSYRNTFVGFVFQEYNILEEFTVEENVALALELQHKKRDKEVIDKILEDVEMTQYATRKPNTLSGGQKQRVAIARALVKNPEIIMADEPTGALDSATGKQVFDTLKKLSKDKLVLIVSHDREFAEQYGDRIIELKDGKIISDMTRSEDESGAEEKNVRFVGTDTVCVQSGAELTDKDFADIKAFLSKNKGQAVITASRDKVDNITRELRGGEFGETAEQPKVREYAADEKKMIRSRLPMRHAIKMGASSMKTKPVRLIFTIFLSIISFLLFGVFSTLMLYDEKEVTANAFQKASYSYIGFSKNYYTRTESYHNGELDYSYESCDYNYTKFTLEEYREWEKKYPGTLATLSTGNSGSSYGISNLQLSSAAQSFYTNSAEQIVLDSNNLELAGGDHVEEDNEILISEFLFKALKAGTVSRIVNGRPNEDAKVDIRNYNDVIGLEVTLGNRYGSNGETPVYKIVGIFKGEAVPEAYSKVEESAQNGEAYSGEERYSWDNERRSGLYAAVAVSEKVFGEFKDKISNNSNDSYRIVEKYFPDYANMRLQFSTTDGNSWDNYISRISKYDSSVTDKLEIYDRSGKNALTSISDNQLVVSDTRFADMLNSALHRLIEEKRESNSEIYEEFWNGLPVLDSEGQPIYEYFYWQDTGNGSIRVPLDCDNPEHEHQYGQCPNHPDVYIERDVKRNPSVQENFRVFDSYYYEDTYVPAGTKEEKLAALGKIYDFIDKYSLNVESAITISAINDSGSMKTVSYAGMFFSDVREMSDCAYVGNALYDSYKQDNNWSYKTITKYTESPDAFIGMIFVPFDKSAEQIDYLVGIHRNRNDDDSVLIIGNSLMEGLDTVNGMVSMFGTIFMWVGIVLAVFSFLLMFNFISASISSKKKEIGILRAIGSRTLDVFKIFLAEAMIIAIICIVIATIGSFLLCLLLNSIMMDSSPMIVTGLLVFGPVSVLIIIGIALLVSVVATVIPVALYSRKPPVESIRAL